MMEQAERRAEPRAHHRPDPMGTQHGVSIVQATIAVVLRFRTTDEITLGSEQSRPVQAGRVGLDILRIAGAYRTGHVLESIGGKTVPLMEDGCLPQHLGLHQPAPRVLPPRLRELRLRSLSGANTSVLVPWVRSAFRHAPPIAEQYDDVRSQQTMNDSR